MTPTLTALAHAFRDLFHWRVLWIVIWPMLLAILLWIILGVAFWETISRWLLIGITAIGMQDWFENIEPRWIANVIQSMGHIILFVPLVFITSLVITALFAMPALIRMVAGSDYPELQRAGGDIAHDLLNALIAIIVYVAIWLFSVPLWLMGVGLVVPLLASTFLNQRLFRYDALTEHADRVEIQALISKYQTSWWGLGLLTSLLQLVPIVNLFAPVLTALAFIHFGLARLTELRTSPK